MRKVPLTRQFRMRVQYFGCANRPFFRIAIMPARRDRDGQPTELVGFYDPMPNIHGEKLCALNFDRIKYWLGRGATPTKIVAKLLGLSGLTPLHPMSIIETDRIRRKREEEAIKAREQENSESAGEIDDPR